SKSESPTSVSRCRGLRLVDVGDIDFDGLYKCTMTFKKTMVLSLYCDGCLPDFVVGGVSCCHLSEEFRMTAKSHQFYDVMFGVNPYQ
ncbi:MAG: hypothetical protein K2H04_04630, partial [Bacteroidaceae bacterium]|nr:hypothetical protein [Bacteroidaceae bacterium]